MRRYSLLLVLGRVEYGIAVLDTATFIVTGHVALLVATVMRREMSTVSRMGMMIGRRRTRRRRDMMMLHDG